MDQAQPPRRRGRPPKDGAAMDGATRQRQYLERLLAKAAQTSLWHDPAPPEALDNLGRDPLQRAKDEAAYLRSDRDRWYNDCLKAEAELRLERQHHLNTTKEKIQLKQRISELEAKPKRRGK